MKRFVLAALALTLAACSTPSEPKAIAVEAPSFDGGELTCRSGYAIANRNGELVCVPEGQQ